MTPLYARRKRTTLAIATTVAAGALLTTGLTAGSSAAETSAKSDRKAAPLAVPVPLAPAARTALLKDQQAQAAATADEIGLGAQEKLVVRDVVKDGDGTVHTRYERTYAGLPVLGGDLVVHETRAGEVAGVTKATKAAVRVGDLTADVTRATAEKQALKAARAEGSTKSAADKAPRKVIWAANGKPALAYETVVGGFQHDGTPQELHVVTDATTGKKLYEWEAIQTGTGHSQYNGTVTVGTAKSGSTYQLSDSSRGNHKTYNKARATSSSAGTLFTDADDIWGTGTATSSSTDQNAAVDAHYGAQVTWDFYKNVLGRNGIKNNGVAAYSRVHYGNAYVNAFWSDSCFCMTYGDGDGNVKPLTSLDVAGHEMTHGLTSNTAGLNYSGESGGLNEATSDILGTAVEFYAANAKDPGDYLIGEKVDIRGNGTPLRYMDKPSKDGNSADSWSSGLGGMDVHYSSGPANHFFYLLSEGSGAKTINGVSYNSPTSNGSTVTGIGRDKAVQIWYKALTTYMTSTTTYKGARTATLNAASALYGSSSTEYKAVSAAWAAVNVN